MATDARHTALLVIDVQNDYWRPPRQPRATFVRTATALLACARRRGYTVVHVQHANPRPNARTFRQGTPGFDIHPSFAPVPGEARIVKHTPGAFFGTGLDDLLRGGDVRRVVVCGMQTQICCDTTAREASARGYDVYVVADAVETFDLADLDGGRLDRDEVARVTLATLANGFATVLPYAELARL